MPVNQTLIEVGAVGSLGDCDTVALIDVVGRTSLSLEA